MLRCRDRLIVILANKKICVRIFILPGPDVMYILFPLICSGCTQCHINHEAREARASGPLQSRGPQHESWHSIGYIYILPTHHNCCPTSNAIYRTCVQVE